MPKYTHVSERATTLSSVKDWYYSIPIITARQNARYLVCRQKLSANAILFITMEQTQYQTNTVNTQQALTGLGFV